MRMPKNEEESVKNKTKIFMIIECQWTWNCCLASFNCVVLTLKNAEINKSAQSLSLESGSIRNRHKKLISQMNIRYCVLRRKKHHTHNQTAGQIKQT